MSYLFPFLIFVLGSAFLIAQGRHSWHMICIILFSLVARESAALFHSFVMALPDGSVDAVAFERVAWEFAQQGPLLSAMSFQRDTAYIYSLIMSVPYYWFGRDPLLLQTLTVLVGSWCVILTWRLGQEIWDDGAAKTAAAIVAIFPTLIMYSALTLREVYFTAFLLCGLIYFVRWLKRGQSKYIVVSAVCFVTAALFHTGALAVLLVVLGFVIYRCIVFTYKSIIMRELYIPGIVLLLVVFIVSAVLIYVDPKIPKAGQFSSLFSPEPYLRVLEGRMLGSAAYPEWMNPSGSWSLLWIIPARVVYFLFSPFIWDISNAVHLIGMLDGVLYIVIVMFVVGNYRILLSNRYAIPVFICLLVCVIVFSIGTGNFGTAIRHRSKVLPVLVVMSVPVLTYFLGSFRFLDPLKRIQGDGS